MKARDFIYFAQGYFEIANAGDKKETLSLEQVKILKSNIQRIEKSLTPDAVEQQCLNTVSFIDGTLSLLEKMGTPSSEILKVISSTIQTKLNETFYHAVDPTYDGDQQNFQDIHDGNDNKIDHSSDFQVRC